MLELPNAFSDPIFLGLLVVILGFFFFLYLLLRRTVLGLQEGYERGRREN